MCGDLDDDAAIGQSLLEQLRVLARAQGMQGIDAARGGGAPHGLADPDGRAAYMDAVFRDGLARAVADISSAEEDEAVDALACQAIALARLAGVLAGQLPPEADLFRTVIEAMTSGHAEPARLAEAQQGAHAHSHDESGHHHH